MAKRDIAIGIEMGGLKQFERAVDRFEEKFINAVKRVVVETAELIQSQAQALAPVDDGNLKQSIEIRYFNRGLSAEIIVGAEYGIYVEYGTGIYALEGNGRKTPWVYWSEKLGRYVYTKGMKAQPYWTPAIELGSKHFERELNKLGA
ncbi:HK97-gp10 family putative phage morphogenesis protein [Virgibacillus sp. Bac330]|uniref:HK97-gp10 family putative phage morphogenesis protein n=1 Tax=Virgibacillus sp. Bac330 TaxID=2419841 RepID=UPI001F09934E|nr:HK97-gp10 family putative phage morphogenesis protein [Virgibacillus sp. Bac330]